MDVRLARTFLEIVSTRSFARAAERLHITQTAVSARVKTLETQLGRRLFERSKAGATLTPAGERFLRHAATLIQVWERARHQVAVPPGRRAVVAVGCELSLSELLLDWLLWMRRTAPRLAVRTEVGFPDELLDRVADGTIDLAIVYAPRHRPRLRIELLIEEKLVLVTTAKRGTKPRPAEYVYVDWGSEFAAQHALAFPQLSNAAVSTSLGPLGREYLLQAGGAGYFRLGGVQHDLQTGRLQRVPGAPEFLYPAYVVYANDADQQTLQPALAALRQAVARGRP